MLLNEQSLGRKHCVMQPHSVLEGVGMGMRPRRSTERRMLTTMATTMTMMITCQARVWLKTGGGGGGARQGAKISKIGVQI